MATQGLAILGMGFICAAGDTFDALDAAFGAPESPARQDTHGIAFPVNDRYDALLDQAIAGIHGGSRLDRSTRLAVYATQKCLENLTAPLSGKTLVNIGSSRGATDTWETEFTRFLETGKTSPKASPYSTPGNLSSNVAQLLAAQAVAVDHSVTCGSGLQALANAAAWISSGMVNTALVGGTEAPLTPFTRAQMNALKITATRPDPFPAKPLYTGQPKTGMALGEGAAVFALASASAAPDARFRITGIGMANEKGDSPSGITGEGLALYGAMKAALEQAGLERPDLILTHAPGTDKGDRAERAALQRLFGDSVPRLLSNKHLFGHTLGASGVLSLITACRILQTGELPLMPYAAYGQDVTPTSLRSVLVNATGFGGNAISVVVIGK